MSVAAASPYSPIHSYNLDEDEPPIPMHQQVELFWNVFSALESEGGTYPDLLALAKQSQDLQGHVTFDPMLEETLISARKDSDFRRVAIYADMDWRINGPTPFASIVKAFCALKTCQAGAALDILAAAFKDGSSRQMLDHFIERYRGLSPRLAYYFGCLKWLVEGGFHSSCLHIEGLLSQKNGMSNNWPRYLQTLGREFQRHAPQEPSPANPHFVTIEPIPLDEDSEAGDIEDGFPLPNEMDGNNGGLEEEPPPLFNPQDMEPDPPATPSPSPHAEDPVEEPSYLGDIEEESDLDPEPDATITEFEDRIRQLLTTANSEHDLLQLAFEYRERLSGKGFNLNARLESLLTDARTPYDYRLTRTIANMDRILNGSANSLPWLIEACCLLKEKPANPRQALTLLQSIFPENPSSEVEAFKRQYVHSHPALWRHFDAVQQFYKNQTSKNVQRFNSAPLRA
jgi:hypothetical protein